MAPLSEHEQKILDEIEKSLSGGPTSAPPGRGTPTQHARRFRLGAVSSIVGFLLLIAFFVTQQVIVGVVAFGAMVVGIVVMAGAASGYIVTRDATPTSAKERFARSLKGWEEALRERYRRE